MDWRRAILSSGGLSAEELRAEVKATLRHRDAQGVRAEVSEHLSHLTQKAGALLSAQAIFLVVDTWGMEHNWSRIAVLISVISLVIAALIVLTLLRSLYVPSPVVDDPETFVFEDVLAVSRIMAARAARFNIALYMTFLSVILLGFGAVEASFV